MFYRIMFAAAVATILVADTMDSNAFLLAPEGSKNAVQEIELLDNVGRYTVRKAGRHRRSYQSLKFRPEYTRHRAGGGKLEPTK